ncbi:MAG: ATP-dependent Clp protease proteolytic subunit [Candidatus Pacebacteria bacterium]|jgi:ATP-dependent protease ClpP protease subunit|nr:ATP-dependent Clp protease proteolytic subunit [Candidatus Paceibacterota bacterium]
MFKKLKLMKKLFPANNPAKIRSYGKMDTKFLKSFLAQLQNSFSQEREPDGLILLIDSQGGEKIILDNVLCQIERLGLPCMGVVENQAFSCGAELLLACQYRIANLHANFVFHHGQYLMQGQDFLDYETLEYIVRSEVTRQNAMMKRFARITGQGIKTARAVYRSNIAIPAERALELGVIHEITEGSLSVDDDKFEPVFISQPPAK